MQDIVLTVPVNIAAFAGRLDGNGNGFYDIFVKSQAIQAPGFEDIATSQNAHRMQKP